MVYIKLVMGVIALVVYAWVFVSNRKRMGWLHALIRFDTVIGIVAGFYLTISSVVYLLS